MNAILASTSAVLVAFGLGSTGHAHNHSTPVEDALGPRSIQDIGLLHGPASSQEIDRFANGASALFPPASSRQAPSLFFKVERTDVWPKALTLVGATAIQALLSSGQNTVNLPPRGRVDLTDPTRNPDLQSPLNVLDQQVR